MFLSSAHKVTSKVARLVLVMTCKRQVECGPAMHAEAESIAASVVVSRGRPADEAFGCRQVTDMCLAVIRCAVENNAFVHVNNYVSKARAQLRGSGIFSRGRHA